jgi:PIN domain nuclease of toxin-antitoxin system
MRVLLDTHVLLWLLAGDERLSPRARSVVEDADDVSASIVNLWEVGLKLSRGSFDVEVPHDWDAVFPRKCEACGVQMLALKPAHCRRIQHLPFHHKDPFDRMLVAQALTENLAILSKDDRFDAYEIKRVW